MNPVNTFFFSALITIYKMGLFLEGEWGRWAVWWVFSELPFSIQRFLFPAGPPTVIFCLLVVPFNYTEQHLLANCILSTFFFPLMKWRSSTSALLSSFGGRCVQYLLCLKLFCLSLQFHWEKKLWSRKLTLTPGVYSSPKHKSVLHLLPIVQP